MYLRIPFLYAGDLFLLCVLDSCEQQLGMHGPLRPLSQEEIPLTWNNLRIYTEEFILDS